jgi:hypothetical protein
MFHHELDRRADKWFEDSQSEIYLPFLTQLNAGEHLDDFIDACNITQQNDLSMKHFLNEYTEAVNENMEYCIEPHQYHKLTKDCTSPLLHSLILAETKLDDLDVGEKADGTYDSTETAVRSFNFWWHNHAFCVKTEPSIYKLRFQYGQMLDGSQALCSATHIERNTLLSHWVSKMINRGGKKSDTGIVLGSTKVSYLNSLQEG